MRNSIVLKVARESLKLSAVSSQEIEFAFIELMSLDLNPRKMNDPKIAFKLADQIAMGKGTDKGQLMSSYLDVYNSLSPGSLLQAENARYLSKVYKDLSLTHRV